ncbi:carbohydrate kinase [Streptomyces sp. P38-E01]|uniref:Carbohydrate kinase n=1 Tax=Streptomyces tardus TaxID=2780544 RepID=A0A949N7T7_9ACTN|nr:carbohydrate kinase [Streptomyces tardus]MBU7597786.1 carbohydrate kinase [Streptomyces tardus]
MLVTGECVADIVQEPGLADRVHPGGSPANVAYGLARLGHEAHFLTQLGDDRLGELIAAHLRSAGVVLHTDGPEDVRTPSAVVHLDSAGSARYSFDIAWTLRETPVPDGRTHLHLGSIGAAVQPGATTVLALAEKLRPTATISYDPNVRPALMGDHADAVAQVERCVAHSDLVKASDEDLSWLYPGRPLESIAAQWATAEAGPALVLITRGAEGALARTATLTVEQPSAPVEVVDTVGAGDAFMSGTLHALDGAGLLGAAARERLAALDTATLRQVLRYGAASAAVTVSRAGANPPDLAELTAALPRD